MKELRRWIVPFFLLLFLLWLLLAGRPITIPEPQTLLFGLGGIIAIGVLVAVIWRQLNYKWRMIMLWGGGSLAVSFGAGLFLALTIAEPLGVSAIMIAIITSSLIASALVVLLLFPLYLALHRRTRALEGYTTYLLKLFPNSLMYINWRASARMELSMFDAALSDYRHGIQIGAKNKKSGDGQLPIMHTNRAAILLQKGMIDAAIKDVNSALDVNPNFAAAYIVHADIMLQMDDTEAALESMEQAISLTPKNAETLTKYGDLLAKLKRKDEAVKAIHDALKLMPNEIHLYTNLTSVLIQIEDYEEALAMVEEGLARTNDVLLQAILRHNRRVAYRHLGNYEQALADCDSLNNVQLPDAFKGMVWSFAYSEQGVVHFLQENYRQAQEDFARAVEVDKLYTVPLLGLAAAQYSNGEIAAAYQTWEQFWSIPSRYHNLGRLRRERYLTESIFTVIYKIAAEHPPTRQYENINLPLLKASQNSNEG